MMEETNVIKILSPDLIAVSNSRHGNQLWTRATLRAAKNEHCAVCGGNIGKEAFRPITNKANRRRRICTVCGVGERIDK
jgi:hypothetical protein